MQQARCFVFGAYRLDVLDERLWHGDTAVRVGHKALAVLSRLVSEPGQLVTKDDLLKAGWPDTAVTDAVLTTAMRELRQALSDGAREPRFIQTVHGRGYRFVAAVARMDPATAAPEPAPLIVGREKEFARLRELYSTAQQGVRRIVFIAGAAGIGKTALVESFVSGVTPRNTTLIGRGQCIEQYGAGEAYLPILEALGRLGRHADAPVQDIFRKHAPSWLAHLPSSSGGESAHTAAATPARMLRELCDAVEVLTAHAPLILVLEDVHWSDTSTLEWLAYAARRRDHARLLVLTTYRPLEAVPQTYALRKLVADMRQQTQCTELALDCLSEDAVKAYVQQRCGDVPRLEALADVLCRRTGGHPLFLQGIVDELVRHSSLDNFDLETISSTVPAGARQFIETRFEALPREDKDILEAASASGDTFCLAAVAAVTSSPETVIESRCASWDRDGQFITADGVMSWPDGTVAARYRFRHALYQEVVYARISPEQRADLHRRIGDRLEIAYGHQAHKIAAELAIHFEQGRDPNRAVMYLAHAARNTLERSAYAEARKHLETGQKLLEALPDGLHKSRRELELLLLLGRVLAATKGWAVEEVGSVFSRAREMCEKLQDTRGLLQSLWGLIGVTFVGADFRKAQAIGHQVLELANKLRDPVYAVLGHMEVGGTSFHLGESTTASSRHFSKAASLYNVRQHSTHIARFGVDMGVFSRSWATHFLWHKGYADRARATSDDTVALARKVSHPLSLALALSYATMLQQFCRDVRRVEAFAKSTIALCTDHAFAYYLAWAEVLQGWSRAANGGCDEGIAEMRRGIDMLEAKAGARLSYYRALLAEACAWSGRVDDALRAVDDGFADVRKTGERWWEAELYRIRGELFMSDGVNRHADAEECFKQALEAAKKQQARSLELRAAASLGRLWRDHGRQVEAHALLSKVHGWFAEGRDLADFRATETILRELTPDTGEAGKRVDLSVVSALSRRMKGRRQS
jgi:DNA-binding winged helix-turn-helix (wHTH) protein/predicted ATPase